MNTGEDSATNFAPDDGERTMIRTTRNRVAQPQPRAGWAHYLSYTDDTGVAQRLRLVEGLPLRIGRRPPCELVLRDAEVSGVHCELLLRADAREDFGMHDGRNRRPPRDPVNACLSLAYTLLHFEAVRMAHAAGLDPLLGFYHRPAFGRESLACDLIEPLRPAVDEWIWQQFSPGPLRPEHFSPDKGACLLGKTGRGHRILATHGMPCVAGLPSHLALPARPMPGTDAQARAGDRAPLQAKGLN